MLYCLTYSNIKFDNRPIIKIGFTNNMISRMTDHREGHSCPMNLREQWNKDTQLILYGTTKGMQSDESLIHRCLRIYDLVPQSNEWYLDSQEIKRDIEFLFRKSLNWDADPYISPNRGRKTTPDTQQFLDYLSKDLKSGCSVDLKSIFSHLGFNDTQMKKVRMNVKNEHMKHKIQEELKIRINVKLGRNGYTMFHKS